LVEASLKILKNKIYTSLYSLGKGFRAVKPHFAGFTLSGYAPTGLRGEAHTYQPNEYQFNFRVSVCLL
jgi:hypothetical protein